MSNQSFAFRDENTTLANAPVKLTPKGDSSLVRVFIGYSLPISAPGSWLGRLLGTGRDRHLERVN